MTPNQVATPQAGAGAGGASTVPIMQATAGGGSAGATAGAASDSGGAGSGGMGGSTVVQGGAAGMAGSGGMGGAMDDLPLLPERSPGCGMPEGDAAGAHEIEVTGMSTFMGHYIVSLPANYSADTNYPVGFAFHGAGRSDESCQEGDCMGFQEELAADNILVYLKSFSDDYDAEGEVRENNVQFFADVLELLKNQLCINEQRVFVAGTSAGAKFSNILACRFGDKLMAAAPVAGIMLEQEMCKGRPAALVIHGVRDFDAVPFNFGEEARDFYALQNGCDPKPEAEIAAAHAQVMDNEESYACVDYTGCTGRRSVRWCEHSYGGYDGSTHGWPAPGGAMIKEFVDALP